jgi:tRNA (guanine-N7-)-methyltransferase
MTVGPHLRRPIRSFVLREGRITEGQRRAFAGPWQRYGVEPDTGRHLDLPELFGNRNPVLLEIGFGNGGALLQMATRHPERNYLGIEVHRPGVGHLLLRLEEQGLANVRVLRQDALELLRHHLADASLDGIYLFFPDPWHKKRHHKRRIVRPEFAQLVARRLKPGGLLHLATDWEDYARHMLEVLDACPALHNQGGPDGFVPRPQDRPQTRFEQRGQRLGHATWDLVYLRR